MTAVAGNLLPANCPALAPALRNKTQSLGVPPEPMTSQRHGVFDRDVPGCFPDCRLRTRRPCWQHDSAAAAGGRLGADAALHLPPPNPHPARDSGFEDDRETPRVGSNYAAPPCCPQANPNSRLARGIGAAHSATPGASPGVGPILIRFSLALPAAVRRFCSRPLTTPMIEIVPTGTVTSFRGRPNHEQPLISCKRERR
jgi:hypothetical protein